MRTILILEDDIRLNETLTTLLGESYAIKCAQNLQEATKILISCCVDLIISDFVLTDGDGFDLLRLINSLADRPKVVFITAFAEKNMVIRLINEKVSGFLEKPFDFSELHKIVKRELDAIPPPTRALILRPYEKILSRQGSDISLTDVEFQILSYFVAQKDRWIAREELIQYVWGQSTNSRNTLDTHLSNLKRKIPDLKISLKVVRGRGFLFSPVEES